MGIQSLLSDPLIFLRSLLLSLPGILLALCGHEAAHGWVALKCGDPTAKLMGRITLNPARHIDPVGFFCMLFVGIGWARPVPVNPRNFRHSRRDDLKVSLAGITANLMMFFIGFMLIMLIIAVAFSAMPSYDLADLAEMSGHSTFFYYNGRDEGLLQVNVREDGEVLLTERQDGVVWSLLGEVYWPFSVSEFSGQSQLCFYDGREYALVCGDQHMILDMEDVFKLSSGIWSFGNGSGEYFGFEELVIVPALGKFAGYAYEMLRYFMVINLSLAVFNLIPLPPLDGYHVVNDLLLRRPLFATAQAQRVGSLILLALVMLGNYNAKFDVISIGLRFIQQHALDGMTTAAYRVAQFLTLI